MSALKPIITGLIVTSTLLLAHPAFAQSAAYSTDMDEVDIATVKSDSIHTASLKQDANVRLHIQHSYSAILPIKIEVLDENNVQVASFKTHDKIIYMHLPEGHYSIKINALLQKKTITVETNDEVLKSYAI